MTNNNNNQCHVTLLVLIIGTYTSISPPSLPLLPDQRFSTNIICLKNFAIELTRGKVVQSG